MRSADQVQQKCAQLMQGRYWPDRLPMGPCETREMLVEQLKTWAADPTTSGGSFAITKDSLNASTGVFVRPL